MSITFKYGFHNISDFFLCQFRSVFFLTWTHQICAKKKFSPQNLIEYFQELHADEYTKYKAEIEKTKPALVQQEIVENRNGVEVELRTPALKLLFQNHYRITSENNGRVLARCKLCDVPISGNLKVTTRFVQHLQVWIDFYFDLNEHFKTTISNLQNFNLNHFVLPAKPCERICKIQAWNGTCKNATTDCGDDVRRRNWSKESSQYSVDDAGREDFIWKLFSHIDRKPRPTDVCLQAVWQWWAPTRASKVYGTICTTFTGMNDLIFFFIVESSKGNGRF